jgi:predicted transcriptional regulator
MAKSKKFDLENPELHAYQDALVRKGLVEMRKGRVVSHAEVVKRIWPLLSQ